MKPASSSSLLTADRQADIMLHPRTPGMSRSYLGMDDFVDDCIQRNQEEFFAENGLPQLWGQENKITSGLDAPVCNCVYENSLSPDGKQANRFL